MASRSDLDRFERTVRRFASMGGKMSGNEFMTSEGDRSGVDIPSHREKARKAVEAAASRLQFNLAHWDRYSLGELEQYLLETHRTLGTAHGYVRRAMEER